MFQTHLKRGLRIAILPRRRPRFESWNTARRWTSQGNASKPPTTSQTTTSGSRLTTNEHPVNDSLWLGTHVWRLACAFGIVYVLTEYGIELTICEGPSMLPTIRSQGEIVLLDRWTPRYYGIQGGTVASERTQLARRKQRQHEKELRQGKGNLSPVTWHEPMIPVNKLSPEGAWSRFWKRQTTPISVGDMVVVQHPDKMGTVCKRVHGLPGDVVTKPTRRAMRDRQRLRRRRSGMVVVPDGHMWLEGDNPWNSSDSRTYGTVPASLIVGRVLLRVWPLRGNALMERGARPERDASEEPELSFSGSIVLPAGYENQVIVREEEDRDTSAGSKANQ